MYFNLIFNSVLDKITSHLFSEVDFYMKKIITLLGAVAAISLMPGSGKNAQVDLSSLSEGEKITYIVEVDDNLNAKTNSRSRNRALNDVKFKLSGFDFEIPYVYDRVLNGFAVSVNKRQASLCEAVLKSSSFVSSVTKETRYAAPKGDNGTTSTFVNGVRKDAEVDKSTEAEKTAYENRKLILNNVSSMDMGATNDQIKAVTGKDAALGKGVTIGIIDTGLILNQVLEFTDAEGKSVENTYRTAAMESMKKKGLSGYVNAPAFRPFTSEDNWTDVLSRNKINSLKKSLTGSNYSYLNNKIPFAYDYVGNDNNVNPDPEEGNHGTHVAGLAAANGTDFQGVSKNAQLAIFKVFGDKANGAGDAAIASALNDAATLGLDMVNLSLGSPLDETKSSSGSAAVKALENCSKAGTIVNFSAGNDGKGSFASTKGYSEWSTDTTETGILGSYAADATKANIVASSNPTQKFYSSLIMAGGEVVQFEDQMVNKTGSSNNYTTEYPFAKTIEERGKDATNYPNLKNADGTYNFVHVKDHGKNTAYKAKADGSIDDTDYKGRIIVCDRGGSVTFESMANAAAAAGAAALIVINNTSETAFALNMSFGTYTPNFPVIFVLSSAAKSLNTEVNKESTGTLSIVSNQVASTADGNGVSSYSSDGSTSDLSLTPTISAPGYQVISCISADVNGMKSGSTRVLNSNLYGYEYMQGTSMASPNLTGAMAAALSEYVPGTGALAVENEEAFMKKKNELSSLMMSTADSNIGTNKKSESIRRQGAGEINASRMLAADSYVTTDLVNENTLAKSKAELKNSNSDATGGTLYHKDLSIEEEAYINIPFTIHNTSSSAKTYKPGLKLLIPSLDVQYTAQDAYDAYYNKDSTATETVADNLTGNISASIYDDEVEVPESAYVSSRDNITVAAGMTATGTVKVRIDNLHVEKNFGNTEIVSDGKNSTSNFEKYKTEDFSGTLREYFNKYFASTMGSYVEGFVTLEDVDTATKDTAKNTSMNFPYLGFYGDYSAGQAVEPFQFEKEDNHLYNSNMIDAYLKNLNASYKKDNAYVGSTLAGHGGAVKSSVINNILNFNTAGLSSFSGEFTDVVDESTGSTRIVAGGEGGSDHLFATFFVQRNVSAASWSITKNGSSVKTGKITNKWLYGGTTMMESDNLLKSWLIIDSTNMNASRAMCDIDLNGLSDGDYQLSFSFTLSAQDNGGKSEVQVKSYPLLIDTVAPVLKSLEMFKDGSDSYLRVTTDSFANLSATTGAAGSTDDNNMTDLYLFDEDLTNTALFIDFQDAAKNTNGLLLNMTDLSLFVFGKGLQNGYHVEKTEINYDTGMWNVEILNQKGDIVSPSGESYKIFAYVGKNITDLSVSEIGGAAAVKVDNIFSDNTAGHFAYDASTGYVVMNLAPGATTFTCNYLPIQADGTPTKASFTPAPTPTPTPDNSTSKPSTDSSTSTDNKPSKSGCGGSVIAASSTLGAIALASIAIAFRKKRED